MIDTWKKMFGPKDSKPPELELANAKIAGLLERCDGLVAERDEAQRKNRELDGLAKAFRSERDAARIERDTAQRERDGYRERLLRFTGPRQRGERGRFLKVAAYSGNDAIDAVRATIS